MTHQKIVSVNDRSGRRRFVAGEVLTKAIQACPTIPPAAIAGMRGVEKVPALRTRWSVFSSWEQ